MFETIGGCKIDNRGLRMFLESFSDGSSQLGCGLIGWTSLLD